VFSHLAFKLSTHIPTSQKCMPQNWTSFSSTYKIKNKAKVMKSLTEQQPIVSLPPSKTQTKSTQNTICFVLISATCFDQTHSSSGCSQGRKEKYIYTAVHGLRSFLVFVVTSLMMAMFGRNM